MPAPLPLPPLPPPRLAMPGARQGRGGLWLSLILHLVLLLSLVEVTRGGNPWQTLEPRRESSSSGGGGGSGNRQVTLINLPPLPPPPASPRVIRTIPPAQVVAPKTLPPPQPVDSTPPTPPITPTAPAIRPAEPSSAGGSGTGTGGGTGSGAGPGSGSGAGPGTGTGTGAEPDSARRRPRPPEPTRVILPPFDYPRTMRGQSIDVNFFVLADGRVDRVVFIPDVADRAYAKRLEDAMRAYRFRPARDAAGQAVSGLAVVKVSF